jgi:predicted small metal-binding protein
MSMRLDCPVDGCHASIEGESEDDVMQQAESHAADKHPDMELDDETVEMIRSKIVQV